jgi:hypothetical protein
MDNRKTLTPSSGHATIKKHLFSEVAQKKLDEGRGDAEGSISCADQRDRVSDPEWPLRAAQFLKPPALPGDTYSRSTRTEVRRRRTTRWILPRRYFWQSSPSGRPCGPN